MKFRYCIYILAAALGLLMAACSDELKGPNAAGSDEATAAVTVRLAAAPMVTIDAVSPEGDSRAINIDDPEDDNGLSTKICNVWCVQFKGTENNAPITGAPAYITSSEFIETGKTDSEGNRMIELNTLMVATPNEKSTLVFLVNTFDSTKVFDTSLTLGQIKAMATNVTKEDDLFAFDDDKMRHLQFNGMVQSIIAADGTTGVDCTVKRNVARVDFTMRLRKTSGLTVTGANVGAALDHSYWLTNYKSISDNFPDVSDADLGISGVSYDVSADGTTIDTTNDDDYDIFTYRFYVPANQRGTVEKSYLAQYKNTYAPHLATYLRINGTYVESGVERPVTLTVYLGENFINNYDLKPNHRYNMTLTMESLDDDAYDSRIQNISVVDYSLADLERANCYMLQPSETADYARRYIIPVDRINTFWGGYGYEDDPSMCIYNARPWVPLVIWADFDYQKAGVTISTTSGETTTINPYNSAGKATTPYTAPIGYGTADKIQVDVPAGAEGNILVGVRRIDSDGHYLNMDYTFPTSPTVAADNLSGFCWSWHLWITDYCPDDIETYQVHPVYGQYVYKVAGGSVHRYSGDAETKYDNKYWNKDDGEFANAFVMDRNLGARSYLPPNKEAEIGGPGYLYYQPCRKDPFGYVDRFTVWVPLLNKANVSFFKAFSNLKDLWFLNKDTYVNNQAEYTRTPVRMSDASGRLHGTYWNSSKDVSSWYVYLVDYGKKSIIDPSPLGWQLPHTKEVWHDFRPRSNIRPTVSSQNTLYVAKESDTDQVNRGFQKNIGDDKDNPPLYYEYWPYPTVVGANDQVPEDEADKIIFPCTGRLQFSGNHNGGFSNTSSMGFGFYATWQYELPGIYTIGVNQGLSSDQDARYNGCYCDRIVPIRCIRYMDYR